MNTELGKLPAALWRSELGAAVQLLDVAAASSRGTSASAAVVRLVPRPRAGALCGDFRDQGQYQKAAGQLSGASQHKFATHNYNPINASGGVAGTAGPPRRRGPA